MSAYTEAVASNIKNLKGVSTGICPGCEQCADDHGISVEEITEQYEKGSVCDEPHFTWSGCDICGSTFGLDAEAWHWVDKNGVIIHESNACVDCVVYLANGDEPEQWQQHPGGA